MPDYASPEYADWQTLWTAVEKAESGKKAQLAYSFDIALQNEFSLEENIALARQFLLDEFVRRGVTVDYVVHLPDKEGSIGNPHFHVMCPIRPLKRRVLSRAILLLTLKTSKGLKLQPLACGLVGYRCCKLKRF